MTLNGVMAVTLRYFTEFGKPALHDLWRNLCKSLLYFLVRVQCRRKESSRSLSHLLMSFLSILSDDLCRHLHLPKEDVERISITFKTFSLLPLHN